MRHADAEPRLPELIGLRAAAREDAALVAHVDGCTRCQARLRRLRSIDAGLRAMGADPAPSQRLERRVLAITGARDAAPGPSRAGWGTLVAAACVAVLIGALGGALLLNRDDGAGGTPFVAEREVAMQATRATDATARIEIGPEDGGRMPVRIVADGLPHGGDRYYGLWLTGADGAISGGSFMPDGEGRCVVMLQVPAGGWTTVAITAGDRPPSERTTVARAAL